MGISKFLSRKFCFAAGTSILIVLTALIGAVWPGFRAIYPEMAAGLIGTLGAYITGNVVAGKAKTKVVATKSPVENPNEVE